MERYNYVENFILRVFEQKKTDKGVILNCAKSGKKKPDGKYEKGMPIKVFIDYGERETEWAYTDLSGKTVDVSGNFSHSEYEYEGKSGIGFSIFADRVREHVWKD